jgi:hypothetical protein
MKSIKDIIRLPYYYVRPCPACESRVTGYLLKDTPYSNDRFKDQVEALKHGEIVKVVPDVPEENCYCLECGFTWQERVPLKMMPMSRIDEEKKERQTAKILEAMMGEIAEKDRHNAKGIGGFARRWFGA